jgi:hypothetical protein
MVRAAVVLGCLALLLAVTASAAPQRDLLIRPGVGIGKVKLGMSLKQVRAVWGKPQAVTVRREGKAKVRLTELQYDFAAYVVTLIGPRGRQRVIRVGTTLAKERMTNGLGVGSLERRLQSALRGRLRCDRLPVVTQPRSPYPLIFDNRRECKLGERGSPQTVFVSRMRVHSFLPEDWSKTAYVFEVVIRSAGA